MRKQAKSSKPGNLGKGKVTPEQIAFIVERYLLDNNYTQTHSIFRTEVPALIARSPVKEAPKSLLTLGAILNEYITLKEQKLIVDQEKLHLEHENIRVLNLVQGMQNVMNAFYSSRTVSTPSPMVSTLSATKSTFVSSPLDRSIRSSAGSAPSGAAKKSLISVSAPPSTQLENKRKCLEASEPSNVAKKPCNALSLQISGKENHLPETNDVNQKSNSTQSLSPHNRNPGGSILHGCNVVKSLFTQSSASPAPLSNPNSPLQQVSTEKPVSPLDNEEENFDIELPDLDKLFPEFMSEFSIELGIHCSEIESKADTSGISSISSTSVPQILQEKETNIQANSCIDTTSDPENICTPI